jgi:hypothetical protein
MNYEDLAHLMWVKQNNQEATIDTENQESAKKVINHLINKMDAIESYIDQWYSQLPLEGMQEVMGNCNAPDRSDYLDNIEGEEAYAYDLGEYIDGLYQDFCEVNLNIKMNDFKKYAVKYADNMNSLWDFIGYLDLV